MPTDTELPVWRTVADAYVFVFRNLKPFFALAAIPIALAVGLWIFDIVRRDGSFGVFFTANVLDTWHYVGALANVLNLSVFAVSWHRYVPLENRDTTGRLQFHIGRREMRFFFYGLIFALMLDDALGVMDTFSEALDNFLSGSFQAVFFGAMPMAFIAVDIVFFVLCMRCLLLFPAVAMESDEDLTVAWTLLRGNTWQLASAMCIASVPLFLLALMLASLFGSLYGSAVSASPNPWELDIFLAVVTHIAGFLIFAAAVTVLSMAFRQIAEWKPPTPP